MHAFAEDHNKLIFRVCYVCKSSYRQGYLLSRKLTKTSDCFLQESEALNINTTQHNKGRILQQLEDLHLLPSLEEILHDYFLYKESDDTTSDKTYQLWKQLDIVISQLRASTLGRKKAKAFLRTRPNLSAWSQVFDKKTNIKPSAEFFNPKQSDEENKIVAPVDGSEETLTSKITLRSSPFKNTPTINSFRVTPRKEKLESNDFLKEFKSPKRKSLHPRRRSTPTKPTSIQQVDFTPIQPVHSTTANISPLLVNEEFNHIVEVLMGNQIFTEKLADNINKVVLSEVSHDSKKELEKGSVNVNEIFNLTSHDPELSDLWSLFGDLTGDEQMKHDICFPSKETFENSKYFDKNGDIVALQHLAKAATTFPSVPTGFHNELVTNTPKTLATLETSFCENNKVINSSVEQNLRLKQLPSIQKDFPFNGNNRCCKIPNSNFKSSSSATAQSLDSTQLLGTFVSEPNVDTTACNDEINSNTFSTNSTTTISTHKTSEPFTSLNTTFNLNSEMTHARNNVDNTFSSFSNLPSFSSIFETTTVIHSSANVVNSPFDIHNFAVRNLQNEINICAEEKECETTVNNQDSFQSKEKTRNMSNKSLHTQDLLAFDDKGIVVQNKQLLMPSKKNLPTLSHLVNRNMFESENSYLDLPPSSSCGEFLSPATENHTQELSGQLRYVDEESVSVADALLLLATSPAKPLIRTENKIENIHFNYLNKEPVFSDNITVTNMLPQAIESKNTFNPALVDKLNFVEPSKLFETALKCDVRPSILVSDQNALTGSTSYFDDTSTGSSVADKPFFDPLKNIDTTQVQILPKPTMLSIPRVVELSSNPKSVSVADQLARKGHKIETKRTRRRSSKKHLGEAESIFEQLPAVIPRPLSFTSSFNSLSSANLVHPVVIATMTGFDPISNQNCTYTTPSTLLDNTSTTARCTPLVSPGNLASDEETSVSTTKDRPSNASYSKVESNCNKTNIPELHPVCPVRVQTFKVKPTKRSDQSRCYTIPWNSKSIETNISKPSVNNRVQTIRIKGANICSIANIPSANNQNLLDVSDLACNTHTQSPSTIIDNLLDHSSRCYSDVQDSSIQSTKVTTFANSTQAKPIFKTILKSPSNIKHKKDLKVKFNFKSPKKKLEENNYFLSSTMPASVCQSVVGVDTTSISITNNESVLKDKCYGDKVLVITSPVLDDAVDFHEQTVDKALQKQMLDQLNIDIELIQSTDKDRVTTHTQEKQKSISTVRQKNSPGTLVSIDLENIAQKMISEQFKRTSLPGKTVADNCVIVLSTDTTLGSLHKPTASVKPFHFTGQHMTNNALVISNNTLENNTLATTSPASLKRKRKTSDKNDDSIQDRKKQKRRKSLEKLLSMNPDVYLSKVKLK